MPKNRPAKKRRSKLIVILGPTASGKSALAVNLARRFAGEIISADSRQIYQGLNIGTGKITAREMKGVPHHLLSFLDPKRDFSAGQFKKLAQQKIGEILKHGRIPLLAGGTGFYIDTVARGIQYPAVAPKKTLRRLLADKPIDELYQMLKKLDAARAKTIDRRNPRRLIRAIEIAKVTGKPAQQLSAEKSYDVLFIGIRRSRNILQKRIRAAVAKRVKRGLIGETQALMRRGLAPKRLTELGLDYGIAADYLKHKISRELMLARLFSANWRYAKRQVSWFKRHRDIFWVSNETEARKLAKHFLKKDSTEKSAKP